MLLEITSLVGPFLVGRELMVETSTHQVLAIVVSMALFVVMQLHNRISLIIEVSLTPHIVSLLGTLSKINMSRVFRCIEHLLVGLQSNGAVPSASKPAIQDFRTLPVVFH